MFATNIHPQKQGQVLATTRVASSVNQQSQQHPQDRPPMAKSAPFSNSSSPVTNAVPSPQALLLARRRLLPPLLVPPICSLLLRPLSCQLVRLANYLSLSHGATCLALAVVLILYVRSAIVQHAPSETKRDDALRKCRVLLPLLAFCLSAGFCRWVVEPVMVGLGHDSQKASVEGNGGATMEARNAAFPLAVMGFLVWTRFHGPAPIFRCSTVPLQSNPFSYSVRSFLANVTSLDSWLDFIAGPDIEPKTTTTPPHVGQYHASHQRSRHHPIPLPGFSKGINSGRYQRPPLSRVLVQIVLTSLCGASIPSLSILPHLTHINLPVNQTVITATATLSALLMLILPILSDGISHELDPRRAHHRSGFYSFTSVAGDVWLQCVRRGILGYTAVLPLFAFVSVYALSAFGIVGGAENGGSADSAETFRGVFYSVAMTTAISYALAILIVAYFMVMDTVVRAALCVPGVNVERLLWETSGCGSAAIIPRKANGGVLLAEDVIINSIALNDPTLIADVISPRMSSSASPQPHRAPIAGTRVDLEDEEVQRADRAMEFFALSILGSNASAITLEEDILRVTILESYGGDGGINGGMGSDRHTHAVLRRIQASESALGRFNKIVGHSQPVIVPVVRALIGYAGGLGEALIRCASAASSQFINGREQVVSTVATWSVPNGAAACGEYAILSAARFLLLHLSPDQGRSTRVSNERHSRLSTLIPAVLHSAHRLRCGVLAYAQYLLQTDRYGGEGALLKGEYAGDDVDLRAYVAVRAPELRPILLACDDAAMLIVRALEHAEGSRDAEVKVQSGCRNWLNELLGGT